MIRQQLLKVGAPVLAGMALLFAGSDSFAQHHGGGGGGGHGGGYHGGGTYHGGGWHDGYHGWGGWGVGIGLGWGYPYGYGWGYGGGSPYYGSYGYSYPTYDYGTYSTPYAYDSGTYSAPSTGTYEESEPAQQNIAHIRVIVPTSDARVTFNGSPTNQTGTTRIFNTPALQTDRSYTYEIRATWREGDRETSKTRTVTFHSGDALTVSFR